MPQSNKDVISELFDDIDNQISSKQYDKAVDLIGSLLMEHVFHKSEKFLAKCLELINIICDKTNYTVDTITEFIAPLLDHEEYWVRQDVLGILKKIYPSVSLGKFDSLIEKCEAKLFDPDKKVREIAVSLVATIIKKSYTDYPDIYLTYCRMFDDDSWKVRAKSLEGVLEFLTPESNPPVDLINALKENLTHLFKDPDEEIRGFASEVMKALCFHMESDEIITILQPILEDDDWEIREKGIWIIGEIGYLYFSEFEVLFNIMISLFSDQIMMIQTKVIDAFVKIGKTQSKNLFRLFLDYLSSICNIAECKDQEDGISETLIFISLQNMKKLLPILIIELQNPIQIIRDIIANCLLKIYMEKPDAFEEELYKMFQGLDPEDWRQRKQHISLVGDLAYILHIQSVAIWTAINLKNWQSLEKDLDVLDEIENSLSKIKNVYENIDTEIQEVEKRKISFYKGLDKFQSLSTNLRGKTEQLIIKKKFNDAEVLLEEEGNRISEKLNEFEKILYESEFKRFSVDILQDFKEIKEEILENISDIKAVMFNQICDGRAEYLEDLQDVVKNIEESILDVKNDYQFVLNLEKKIENLDYQNDPSKIESFLDRISHIREKLYTLEFKIGQTWLNNLEFKEFLKEVTIYWVDVKIEVQQYIGNIFQKFNLLQSEIDGTNGEYSDLKRKITFNFLNSNLQNIILQAVQSQRDVLERFDSITEPIYQEIKKRRFKEAHHLVSLTINNLYNTIENYNKEINHIYNDLDKINLSAEALAEVRNYVNNWADVKDSLIEKIRSFQKEVEDELFIQEVREYLKYMNPIPLDRLEKALSIQKKHLKDRLFALIEDRTLHAEIHNEELIIPERPLGENLLSFSRKVEIIGSRITFNLRIYNPTKFFLNDMGLIFIFPEFLNLQKEDSDLTEIFIREFEPEAIRVIQWNFRLEKQNEKKYEVKKWLLNVSYRNPFDEITTFQKEMEIIF
ncbi:hypothetical protein NEF87_003957 [Candidatus Lokiarchaeum ossiferum]|uniref:HEAT repeat domain-containing protein n=1 Tax=Candidatus Lokiarchaeum ossiferum TaxID=2951803 RepID=A0ABY6HVX5_9ARCH|nr:hypothetical protein NEF87_003957 [Candidatus Lokiarchaeum sp. B-35]